MRNSWENLQRSIAAKRLFVGRTEHLHFFVHDILEPEYPSYNIISISGQGGVGKSTLLQCLLDEARSPNFREYCFTALVNERQLTAASVMERIADQFRERGHPLKKLEDALSRYKEALHRLQVSGYQDEQGLFVREMIDVGGTVINDLPFVGGVMHKGANMLTDVVLEHGRTRQVLKDMAHLEDPIGDMTTGFVKDLNQIADTFISVDGFRSKHPSRVLLFFDTFEQLSADIAPWLLEYFLEMDVSTNIVLVVAGRDSIESSLPNDPKRWLPFLDNGTIHLIPLRTFGEEETQLVVNYGCQPALSHFT